MGDCPSSSRVILFLFGRCRGKSGNGWDWTRWDGREIPFLKCVDSIWALPKALDPAPPSSVKRANMEKSAQKHPGKPLPPPPLSPLAGNAHIWKQHISKGASLIIDQRSSKSTLGAYNDK